MKKRSSLLLNEYPIIVLPKLAQIIGLNESIILQQVHYWLEIKKKSGDKKVDGRNWIYNTYDEWKEQFPFWSISTIRRTITSLENKGIMKSSTKMNKKKFDQTKWYSIRYSILEKIVEEHEEKRKKRLNSPSVQNEQTRCSKRTDHLFKMNRPIPETTTETTTDVVVVGESPKKCQEEQISIEQIQTCAKEKLDIEIVSADACRLLKAFGVNTIIEKINYVARKNIHTNALGYLQKALAGDWDDTMPGKKYSKGTGNNTKNRKPSSTWGPETSYERTPEEEKKKRELLESLYLN